ncbi:uncharacterized protein LOC113140978 [Mastacembelus armatus]|uniref:uncharacterized protein LOC113140978 n=1 Tax=Mastacembelus armatus TaxID=205130 RepID=UPI000E45B763|nr:uncharacterized protein LOC113140978 [Mastacembelus armatus]
MVCWILLLISLTPFTWGTFVVNVTQSSYQAEENHDITLDWTFTAPSSSVPIYIFCERTTDEKVLFRLHEGVEVPESQDKQFSGRVQFDKDVLREGRVRLHVSRLRTEDSGLYLCEVQTGGGSGYADCRLNVTAASDQPRPLRPEPESPEPERPEPESRGSISLYIALGAAVVVVVVVVLLVILRFTSSLCFTEPADVSVNASSVV